MTQTQDGIADWMVKHIEADFKTTPKLAKEKFLEALKKTPEQVVRWVAAGVHGRLVQMTMETGEALFVNDTTALAEMIVKKLTVSLEQELAALPT